ncbi:hypothetical protein [Roseateles terrae]|uniref:Uncharacterized protein n=1 Tax=Roseateles terrae TaxID=431060 RepID=A0ABR6GS79_9BURK|nr:hypothetical protein [Roseateles terrae]MBB3194978.1 hypothetical protein [Roseateles terrae]
MDGVIAFFRGFSPERLESELQVLQQSSDPETFVFFMYGEEQWRQELTVAELDEVVRRLGAPPSAAACFCRCRGSAAGASLDVLQRLIDTFPACVVDDDFGSLWNPDDLRALGTTAPPNGPFGLKDWARPAV